jgi:prepilin-type N-terminal cleavage/methylation domain-containing protein
VRARHGFTLLEAAVALTIITIVVVGAMGAFGADLRAADRARQLLPASSLAHERMAALDLADPRVLRMLPDSLSRGTFNAPLDAYSWKATAAEVRGEPGLIEMTVTITWVGGEFSVAQRRYRPVPASIVSVR